MSDIIKLSVSKSATFNSCKKKYQFSYILRLPKKEFEYHTFGRFVHRVLELFHLAYIGGTDHPQSAVMRDSFNESLKEFKGKISAAAHEQAVQILKKYLEIYTANKDKFKVLDAEKTFNVVLNESVTLTGMIDRVQLDSDGIYHVVDYKTSKSKLYLKDDTLQLLTYAYILYLEHPEITKVRVSYIMLKLDCESLTKEFTIDEIKSVKDIYESYAKNINAEVEFKASPSKLCAYCDFINECEEGKATVAGKFTYGKTSW